MPEFLRAAARFLTVDQNEISQVNRYEGFQSDGAVVLRDRRGTSPPHVLDSLICDPVPRLPVAF